ncbi:hypothetical protein GYMLUDRAFT_239087 [Collybiopsis luxurians FD-317 M1]|nr:hypothetical protein GYMLUDRAFT_239087 [Collybiopsis luxurians FD-317 M1]
MSEQRVNMGNFSMASGQQPNPTSASGREITLLGYHVLSMSGLAHDAFPAHPPPGLPHLPIHQHSPPGHYPPMYPPGLPHPPMACMQDNGREPVAQHSNSVQLVEIAKLKPNGDGKQAEMYFDALEAEEAIKEKAAVAEVQDEPEFGSEDEDDEVEFVKAGKQKMREKEKG